MKVRLKMTASSHVRSAAPDPKPVVHIRHGECLLSTEALDQRPEADGQAGASELIVPLRWNAVVGEDLRG